MNSNFNTFTVKTSHDQDDAAEEGKHKLAISLSQERFDGNSLRQFAAS